MTAGVSLPDAPALADRRVFTSNGVVFTVADLARRARVGGRGAPATAQEPRQVEESFRRSRGLLTADGLQSWLTGWSIDPEDFRRWTDDVGSGTSTATAWCALLCSGELDAITAAVASAAAAACELGAGPTAAADFDPAGWTERLVAARSAPTDLAAVIDAHRLDWTRLQTVAVLAAHRGVAEELRHQVLSDGIDLRTAARHAGLPAQDATDVLASFAPPAVRAAVAGARAGELVGPVPMPAGWLLLSVLTRTEPTPSDEATRVRAEATVRTRVIARAVARHVVA